jgi:hypothetical protein
MRQAALAEGRLDRGPLLSLAFQARGRLKFGGADAGVDTITYKPSGASEARTYCLGMRTLSALWLLITASSSRRFIRFTPCFTYNSARQIQPHLSRSSMGAWPSADASKTPPGLGCLPFVILRNFAYDLYQNSNTSRVSPRLSCVPRISCVKETHNGYARYQYA